MILLSDEDICALSGLDADEEYPPTLDHQRGIAKAQLKKIRDNMGVELCSCDKDDDGLTYRIPFENWQELLKECE